MQGSGVIMNRAWIVTCLSLLVLAAPLRALPPVQVQAALTDETHVELTVLGQAIRDDVTSWCEVSLRITGDVTALSAGDSVQVEVYEDDAPLWDDLLWESSFTVSAAEASAGRLERTLDCTSNFSDDLGAFFEVYALATISKEAGPLVEEAETPVIDVQIVDDDFAEDDDAALRATLLAAADAPNRICRDEDWFSVTLSGQAAVSFTVTHLAAAGRLDAVLRDETQTSIFFGVEVDGGVVVEASSLAPGTYFLRVSPRASADFAFYDLRYDYLPFSCTPDEVETRDCGLCGSETRTCGGGGVWGTWSACAGEGECEPGAVEVSPCVEGTTMRTCDDLCAWGDPGACVADPLGAPCSTDEQCGTLDCLSEGGLFMGGYCGLTPCGSDDVCGTSGACLPAFGGYYCLLECAGSFGCRLNYLCAEIEGVSACLPRCRDHSDCQDGETPICDPDSGLCLPDPVADAGTDAASDATPRGDAAAGDAASADVVAADAIGAADVGLDAGGADDEHEGTIAEEGGGCLCGAARGHAVPAPLLALGLLSWMYRRRISSSS